MYNLKIKKILSWFYVILWCGIIFFFSHIPYLRVEQLGIWDFVFRKVVHISEYCILVILILRAFFLTTGLAVSKIYFLSTLLSILYAISDEIHQYFVPGRNCSVYDVLVDTVGIVIGIFLWHKSKYKLLKK